MSFSSAQSLLDSLTSTAFSDEGSNKDTENAFKKIFDNIKYSNRTSICNFLCDGEAIHSSGELAMVLCNHIHKKATSAAFFEESYEKNIVDFLIKNGEMIYRNASQAGRDITYIFLYKNMFITAHDMFEKKYIKSLNFYHPIDLAPPVEDFEQFRVINKTKESKIGIIKQTRYGLTVSNLKVETDQKLSLIHI